MVSYFKCYDFNCEWLLIEMILNIRASDIDWSAIVVPDDAIPPAEWQCPYMEQYLNLEGTARICEAYNVPTTDISPCRVAFFIYKNGSPLLNTPYGNFDLTDIQKLPDRLKDIIEFDED